MLEGTPSIFPGNEPANSPMDPETGAIPSDPEGTPEETGPSTGAGTD